MKHYLFLTATIAFVTALALSLLGSGSQTEAAGGPQLISVFGEVPGSDLRVHVTAVVPSGRSVPDVAREVLAAHGARPIGSSEFTTTGLVWDQFSDGNAGNDFVTLNYNDGSSKTDNDPLGGGGQTALANSMATWTAVASSSFAFDTLGSTSRCPSLVQECRGPQKFDGNNDVAWMQLNGCCTLGVTWYSTSTDETDMALNTSFDWLGSYDAETVFLHEGGHVTGLGHSDVTDLDADGYPIMHTPYSVARHTLHADDIAGLSALYPVLAPAATGTIAGTVTAASDGAPIAGADVSVDGTGLSDITAGDGSYSIPGVPVGSYDVSASASGYDSQTQSASVSDGATTTVDFALVVEEVAPPPPPPEGDVTVSDIAYGWSGGPDGMKHLTVTVTVSDSGGAPIEGASVAATLSHEGGGSWDFGGVTGADGSVNFKLIGAGNLSGCFDLDVTSVTGAGTWDGQQPDDSADLNRCK